ncbi:MAG: S8 family serine peptidase [Bacteroidetes bacterium]|nr:S8 family serine peptidase [Bacteroidota bacterium]
MQLIRMLNTKRQNYEKPLALLVSIMLAVGSALAQQETYRITFTDKGPQPYAPGTALYLQTLRQFAPRTIARRTMHGVDPVVGYDDVQLYAPYLDSLRQRGITPFTASRWRNCVLADIDSATAVTLRSFSFVRAVQRTADVSYVLPSEPDRSIDRLGAHFDDCSPMRYGLSLQQNVLLNTPTLHEAGVFGQGVVVGIIDNGFRWRSNATFRNARVLGEYDVVYGDSITANDSNDVSNQDGHGTIVMSLIAGLTPDTLIGVAPGASFLLAKSEDMRGEFRREEDNYAVAMEWLERIGADVVTSSIGYRYFDSAQAVTPYDLFDGKSTFAAQAVNRAVAYGVVCVTAAGNDGQRPRTLITPADADSVISVGNVLQGGDTAARSSSVGPTADGRVKPDIMAMGVGVISGVAGGGFIYTGGTSMSAPQIAGCCALLKSLHPTAHSYEIRKALFQSGTLYPSKDTVMGFGRPDVAQAAALIGPCLAPPFVSQEGTSLRLTSTLFTNTNVTVTLRVLNGPRLNAQASATSTVSFVLPSSVFAASDTVEVRYEISTMDSTIVGRYPADTTFLLARNGVWTPCGGTMQHGLTDVPAFEETSSSMVIAPMPVDRSIRRIEVSGIDEQPHSISLSTVTGDRIDGITVLEYSNGRTVVGLPSLVPGWYVVSIATATAITSRPLLVR